MPVHQITCTCRFIGLISEVANALTLLKDNNTCKNIKSIVVKTTYSNKKAKNKMKSYQKET
jgi:hypothetical protein